MTKSSERKKALYGWLNENNSQDAESRLKVQKFLFFYETLSKIEGDEYELDTLKGYKNGPVFDDVYGDMKYDYHKFKEESKIALSTLRAKVKEDRAKVSDFLIKIHNEADLSEITHYFNIWKNKELEIEDGALHLPLAEGDLSESDICFMQELKESFPIEYIDSVQVLNYGRYNFVMSKKDYHKLTYEQEGVLVELSELNDLVNPVFIELEENGGVSFD